VRKCVCVMYLDCFCTHRQAMHKTRYIILDIVKVKVRARVKVRVRSACECECECECVCVCVCVCRVP
jgi:hypothetical protein